MTKIQLSLFAALSALCATAALAEPVNYLIEPTHTSANFEIRHLGMSTIRGRFDKEEGSITLDKAASTGKVSLSIPVNSINTGVPAFDKHLQSADLFNAEKFPAIAFESERVNFADGERVGSVDGKLTLLGQTQPVRFVATHFHCIPTHPQLKREACGGTFEATIDRTQWGMNYGTLVSSKDVKVVFQIEAIRAQ
jgi:polyisoprenoid-binding protein YceI